MAWTTPRTWVDGEITTGALVNTHLRDQFNVLSGHSHTGAAGQGALLGVFLSF